MQPGYENKKDSNVISIFKRNGVQNDTLVNSEHRAAQEAGDLFTAVVERNRQLAERVKRDRAQANKAVLRAYRIKT